MRSFLIYFLLLSTLCLHAANPAVRSTPHGLELRNKHVSIIISDNAEMVSCVDLKTGNDIALHDHSKIAYATGRDGSTIIATHVSLVDEKLRLLVGDKIIDLAVCAFDDYFTIEVIGSVPAFFNSFTFIDLKMKYDFNEPRAFLATGVAMTLQTDPIFYPSGEKKNVVGRCYSRTGCQGAKLAIIVCGKEQLRGVIKEIYESIPKGVIPINRTGGPFALEYDNNRDDCVLIRDVKPSDLNDLIEFYSQFGIKQFEFLQGSSNFIQGQFSFPSTGSAEAFKREITDPLRRAGILSLLHTYSYYISYQANDILSDPHWQQQLEFREVFTLKADLSLNGSSLELIGDRSVLKDNGEFWSFRSPYMLIDNEIVKFSIGQNGITCQRGRCGTHPSNHKAGVRVRIIGGKFSHIAPQIGSELYYEVARRTAEAYNKGGFSGIYFDAFDGLLEHLKYEGLSDYRWYYGASFINEVLKNCECPPIVEYSDMIATVWSGRGRGVSWDIPYRGYKNFIDDHIAINTTWRNRLYVTTLGWYDFYPTQKDFPGNYATKYMFFDDVDYVGTNTIAYDQTMVHNGLKKRDVETIPALQRNLNLYALYCRLRTENYFNERVRSLLREGRYEYKLDRKYGNWGFYEALYCRRKLRDIETEQVIGNNPFKRQKPFIRLECLYSSGFDSVIPIISFNEQSVFAGQKYEAVLPIAIDMSRHLGLRVSIQGNGIESSDAVCIRLRSSSSSGYADYVIRLDFEGQRDILLTDLDNAENPDLVFVGMEDDKYKMHRKTVDFSHISSIGIYKTKECGVIRINKIEAVPLIPNTLNYPSIHLGNASISFNDSLHSGEYIEYAKGARTATVYDSLGFSRTIRVTKKGRFRIPSGQFSATVKSASETTNPAQAVLTIGLYGQFIQN